MRNLNIRKQLKEFASKEFKSHDGNYNKNLFPPIKDYSSLNHLFKEAPLAVLRTAITCRPVFYT